MFCEPPEQIASASTSASICSVQRESNASCLYLVPNAAAAGSTRMGWVGVGSVGQVGAGAAGSNFEGQKRRDCAYVVRTLSR